MKNLSFLIFSTILFFITVPQLMAQVGIGTTTPNANALLEIDATTTAGGLLLPRLTLTGTANTTPLTAHVAGMTVYNTATAADVSPGFYFNNGTQWVRLEAASNDWKLSGNAGTIPTSNFLGTTDAVDFVIRTDNLERLRTSSTGNIGIATAPIGDSRLTVDAAGESYSITGMSTNGVAAIHGKDAGSGIGVRGESNSGDGITGITLGGPGLFAGVYGLATRQNSATAILGIASSIPTTDSNIGLRAISGSTISISPAGALNIGITTNATDLGLYVLTEKTTGNREAAQFKTNFAGSASNYNYRDPGARLAGFESGVAIPSQGTHDTYYGGYFYSGGDLGGATASYAYAGARRNTTNYKIIGNGVVSTIVKGLEPDEKKTMFAAEAPEVLFEDYGTGQLINGTAKINIDPLFSKNIHVSSKKPLKVFIQLEGDCNGVYVTNKSAKGFTVKELQNGNANVSFSWHIVANRADEIFNEERTVYQSLRFPDAPDKIQDTSGVATSIRDEKVPTVEKPHLSNSEL